MAKCGGCGRETGFLGGAECQECLLERIREERSGGAPDPKKLERQNRDHEVSQVLLTTEAYPEGLKIEKRIEVVTAECAFGMNLFKDLFAGVRDVFGGRSEAVQKTLRDSRRTALYELKKEAHAVGANAVVGIDLDYVELSGAGNMVLLVASGTAVRIEGA
ncbi:YbjQ family protein [Roseivivax sp. CAU 1753]